MTEVAHGVWLETQSGVHPDFYEAMWNEISRIPQGRYPGLSLLAMSATRDRLAILRDDFLGLPPEDRERIALNNEVLLVDSKGVRCYRPGNKEVGFNCAKALKEVDGDMRHIAHSGSVKSWRVISYGDIGVTVPIAINIVGNLDTAGAFSPAMRIGNIGNIVLDDGVSNRIEGIPKAEVLNVLWALQYPHDVPYAKLLQRKVNEEVRSLGREGQRSVDPNLLSSQIKGLLSILNSKPGENRIFTEFITEDQKMHPYITVELLRTALVLLRKIQPGQDQQVLGKQLSDFLKELRCVRHVKGTNHREKYYGTSGYGKLVDPNGAFVCGAANCAAMSICNRAREIRGRMIARDEKANSASSAKIFRAIERAIYGELLDLRAKNNRFALYVSPHMRVTQTFLGDTQISRVLFLKASDIKYLNLNTVYEFPSGSVYHGHFDIRGIRNSHLFNEVKHLEREPGYGEIVYGVVYNTSEGRIEVYPFGLSSGNPIAISNEKILIPYAEAEKFGFRIPPEFALPKKVSVLQKIAGLLGLPRKPKMPTSRTGNSSVVEIAPGIFVQGNHSGNFESRKPSGKGKGKRRR